MLDTIRLKNKIKIFIAVKIKKIVAQGCQRTKSILEQREKKKKKHIVLELEKGVLKKVET